MKKISLINIIVVLALFFPGSLFAGINPDGDENCSDNTMLTPTNYSVTVSLPGSLDCAAMNGCGCTFRIAIYACNHCPNPTSCTLLASSIFSSSSTSYPFTVSVDPDHDCCICARFEDTTTPHPCGCWFNPDVACHDICRDPSTSFTLNLYPCGGN
jgi:hypothetical protein